jgi:myosin heavy subunit
MLAGMSDGELSQLRLKKNPSSYSYLALSECFKVDTIDDVADWKLVLVSLRVICSTPVQVYLQKSMTTLGFKPETRQSLFRVLAGILLLGNITFSGSGPNDTSSIKNPPMVTEIEELWMVTKGTLARALTSRSITTGVGKRASAINIPLDTNNVHLLLLNLDSHNSKNRLHLHATRCRKESTRNYFIGW